MSEFNPEDNPNGIYRKDDSKSKKIDVSISVPVIEASPVTKAWVEQAVARLEASMLSCLQDLR